MKETKEEDKKEIKEENKKEQKIQKIQKVRQSQGVRQSPISKDYKEYKGSAIEDNEIIWNESLVEYGQQSIEHADIRLKISL